LFVVERAGRILIVDGGTVLASPFLDIASIVRDNASEQGLLGLAFHPDYASNGRFFVYYTDNSGDVVVAEYSVSADPDEADPASAQVVLMIPQPAANHNGGMLAFGPDGYLYAGVGDGGGAGDPSN
jgi:glucose/arabinose dehydrogenase